MAEEDDWAAALENIENKVVEPKAKVEPSKTVPDQGDRVPGKDEQSLLNKVLRTGLQDVKHEVEICQKDPNSPLYSVKTFEELNLREELLKGVYQMGYTKPSKIQETALPMILAEPPTNMIAQSQSGTGKTAAFLLGMLSRVKTDLPYPQALCLSPTFELAMQTGKVLESLGKYMIESSGLKINYAIRGSRLPRNQKIPDHIIVGTPGTILDWIFKLKIFDPKKLSIFIFDEADVMISQQGHKDTSIRIKNELSPSCQMLLFSATYEAQVMNFAQQVIKDPLVIKLRREEESLDNIIQRYVMCTGESAKYQALANLYGTLTIGQSMVFCHTRKSVNWLAGKMSADGHAVAMLTGELELDQRIAVLDRFREGKEKLLITTNVAARGIDVESVTMVVNFDLPIDQTRRPDFDTYLHRIGRTGRFGKKGYAINLCDDSRSEKMVKQIEEHFGNIQIKLLDSDSMLQLEQLETAEE